ncbi:MAG: (d)CMP kinase [Clostridia bacterium]|nr:(d)CMP kinase [Clostridia bacterium]
MSFIVAIDGPAGSGKGTVAKALSQKYNFINIETGAMYRCIALKCLNNDITLDEKEKIIELSKNIDIILNKDGTVILDGKDVTSQIRTKAISDIVPLVSSIKEVRQNLIALQRKMAEGKNVVMEGRDITTKVFPNANVKIYLDATVEERANRRYKEMIEKGTNTSYEEVLESIKQRDERDRKKEIGLMIAPDAIVVDTTGVTIENVIKKISQIIENTDSWS